jgi:opacity protein-like surface antigen
MSLVTRLQAARNRAVMGGAALLAGMVAAPGAWAQCTDNFNVALIANGQIQSAQNALPLGKGASIPAFLSTVNTINTAFLTQTTAFVSAPGNPRPDQQGSGAWARTIAGTVDVDTTSTGRLDSSAVLPGVANTGTQKCNSTARQDYWAYQLGHDISILNGGASGVNWHFGVTAGYFTANTKDITGGATYTNPLFPGTTFNSPRGSFEADTDVPFVGLYTAVTRGGFFMDGQARWDFFQNSLSDVNNGLRGQELNAHGFSLTGNMGYNHALGRGWFLEPSGGLVWSRVWVDPLNVAGVPIGNSGGRLGAGTVTLDDIDSLLGRLSLRVGTNFTHGGMAWQPFFTASVFHEFAGDVTARAVARGNDAIDVTLDGVSLTTSTSRIGTYGQFGLGTAAAIINTGWLGYARVDYKTGEDIEGWNFNAGLRYQFTPEHRAGGIKDGPAPAIYAYNWTGPYIGASAGALVWGDEGWIFQAGRTKVDGLDYAGALAGGQVGYNLQVGQTVYGIEADYGWSNAHGGASCPNQNNFTCEAKVDGIGTVTGRVGLTLGRALFYGKGGLAFGDVTLQTRRNDGTPTPTSNTAINSSSETSVGWAFGGGMEFALTDRWSAKAEYMHYDLGKETFTVDNNLRVQGDTQGSTVRIGVNLHLNPVQREVAPIK